MIANDTVTLQNEKASSQGGYIYVNGSAGQVSTLTLSGGTFSPYVGGIVTPGSAGTVNVNLNDFTINTSSGFSIGGSGAMTTNFNASGTLIDTELGAPGLSFGGGITNVNISNSNVLAADGVTFGSSGTVMAALSQFNYNDDGGFQVGIGTGNATVTINNASKIRSTNQISVGTLDYNNYPGFSLPFPDTGGGTGVLVVSNSSLSASRVLVGTSGGNGLVSLTSGSSLTSSEILIVGDLGTGLITIAGGTLTTVFGSYIGANSGTGTVALTTPTSLWTASGENYIGTYNGSNGNGLVSLDHHAALNVVSTTSPLPLSGDLYLSPTGALSILSGSRVSAQNFNESSGAVLTFGLDGTDTIDNGLLNVSNAALFAGTLNVTLEDNFTPMAGESFQLFTAPSETGSFSTINLPPQYTWDISDLYSQGIITTTALVPEPATVSVLALAIPLLRRRTR